MRGPGGPGGESSADCCSPGQSQCQAPNCNACTRHVHAGLVANGSAITGCGRALCSCVNVSLWRRAPRATTFWAGASNSAHRAGVALPRADAGGARCCAAQRTCEASDGGQIEDLAEAAGRGDRRFACTRRVVRRLARTTVKYFLGATTSMLRVQCMHDSVHVATTPCSARARLEQHLPTTNSRARA